MTRGCEVAVLIAHLSKKKKRSSGYCACAISCSTDGLYHWRLTSPLRMGNSHFLNLPPSVSHPHPLHTERSARRWKSGSREGANLSFTMDFRASKNTWMLVTPTTTPPNSTYWRGTSPSRSYPRQKAVFSIFDLMIREPPLCSGQQEPTLHLLAFLAALAQWACRVLLLSVSSPTARVRVVDAHNEVHPQRKSDLYPVGRVFSGGDDALPGWHWAITRSGGKG